MVEPTDPLLGKRPWSAANCTYTAPGGTCGKPSTIHVIWYGRAHSGCCDEHLPILKTKRYWQIHSFEPVCANPLSLWFEEEERCRIPSTGEDFINGVYLMD